MNSATKIGVVTVLYKSDEVLPDFYKSFNNQSFKNFVIYLIDNSPNPKTDILIASLNNQYSNLRTVYIACNSNIGVAAGNNEGIKHSLKDNCSHVLLSNNDIEFENSELLSSMVKSMEINNADLLVPKILYFNTNKIWCAGGHFDTLRSLGVHDGIHEDSDNPECNIAKNITYSPTCFMLVKSTVFNKIGLMDEKYFVYVDDTDFVYRAVKDKLIVWYESSVELYHKVSTSTGGDDNPFYVFYSNRNKIYFIRKHYNLFLRASALAYFFITRIIFYLRFNKEKRVSLINGIKAGFKL